MISVIAREFDTLDENWAFNDGVKAGIKAMCKKYNIDESDVYKKEATQKRGVKK